METIALVCGIAGIVASVLSIIIIFLTRQNIADIIDKDVILFEGNFEIKKNVFVNALEMVDLVAQHGKQIRLNQNFIQNAKKTYNELLCVAGDIALAKEFYAITLNQTFNTTTDNVEHFKLLCRKDIGYKTKVSKHMPESNQAYLDNFSNLNTKTKI